MTSSPSAVSASNKRTAALHAGMWVLLFLLSFFFTQPGSTLSDNLLPLLFSLAVFYLNYNYLIVRFLLKRKIRRFFLTNILLTLSLALLLLYSALPVSETHTETFLKFFVLLLLTSGLSLATKITLKWFDSEREKTHRENQHFKTELSMLRYQIQPHFFFNSLNNIYSLIDIAPEKAKETVHGLGKLMRYLLYETSAEQISLEKETDFLQNFIHLMQIRVSEQVKVSTSFPDNTQGVTIPPLLFVSMVENAFKHGVSSEFPSEILISMRIENRSLIFIVQNSYFPKGTSDKSGSGVGMENLRSRLEKMYPNQYSLTQNKTDNYFTSTLTLPL